MHLGSFKVSVWAVKQAVALLIALVPYFVAKVTNPVLASWIESNAPMLITIILSAVTGVDLNSLHTQNATAKKTANKVEEAMKGT